MQMFLGGKIRGTLFSGRYLIGLTDQEPGRVLICELLQVLQQGQTIPLCDFLSYYAHGKRWSLGMVIHQGTLWMSGPASAWTRNWMASNDSVPSRRF